MRPIVAFTAAVLAMAAVPAAAAPLRNAVFAGGCFWSMEKAFETVPGVADVVSGFSGGARPRPTYENHTGHLEAVRVTYDPARVSYARLVDYFYRHIDPTDPDGQVCDKGPSYRTAVFVANAQERQTAEATRARVEKLLGARVTVATRDVAAFWPAEAYHQDYARKNPLRYERYRVGCGRDRVIRAVWAGR